MKVNLVYRTCNDLRHTTSVIVDLRTPNEE